MLWSYLEELLDIRNVIVSDVSSRINANGALYAFFQRAKFIENFSGRNKLLEKFLWQIYNSVASSMRFIAQLSNFLRLKRSRNKFPKKEIPVRALTFSFVSSFLSFCKSMRVTIDGINASSASLLMTSRSESK